MRYNCIVPSALCLTLCMFGFNIAHGRTNYTTFYEQAIPTNTTQEVFTNATNNFCKKPLVNYLPWRIRYKLGKQCLKSGNWLLTSTKDSLNEKMTSLAKSADQHRQTVADAAKTLQQSIGVAEKLEKPKFERVRVLSKLYQTSHATSVKSHNVYFGVLASMFCIIIGFTST